MDALTENALANMPGPDFLGFYVFLAAAAVVTLVFVGLADDDRGGGAPLLPARPDPYQIAFLRDGYGGVVWLAIYALKRAGFLAMSDSGQLRPLARDGSPKDACEARVLGEIGQGCAASAIAAGTAAKRTLHGAFDTRLRNLEAQSLVRGSAVRERVRRLAWSFGVALALLAVYKLFVAEAHGHRNVGFLVFACVFTLVALTIVGQRFGMAKPTARGRALLERVKLAYSEAPKSAADTASFGADPALLLTVAAVGFAALSGGPDAAFAQQARKSDGSGGGCSSGSSCSSGGDGGGGGGCGGCGGGD